jgi:hypothetical protein
VITGSLNVSGSITGSLLGTASFATTASYALNAGAGAGFPFSGSAVITGSLLVSGSGLTVTGSVSFRNIELNNAIGNVMLYDTTTGQLYYTASSAIGGGSGPSSPSSLIFSGSVTASVDVGTGNVFTVASGSTPITLLTLKENQLIITGSTANRSTLISSSGVFLSRTSDGGYASNITANGNMFYNTRNAHAFKNNSINSLWIFESGNVQIATQAGDLGDTSGFKLYVNGSSASGSFNANNTLIVSGSGTTITGSLNTTGSVLFRGLTTTSQNNVVTIDTSTGQLYYTASSAIGGGGGGSLTGGQTNYLPLWNSATTLTSSIARQEPAVLQFNSPSVNVEDLYEWYGYNDKYGSNIGIKNDIGFTIQASTTSSLVLDDDITGGGSYPLPQTWTNIQLTDNEVTTSAIAISDPYYTNISSITFYSQSLNGGFYTIFYSSSISPNTFLPNTIYTSVTNLQKSIYISGGLTVSSSNISFLNLSPTSSTANVLVFDSASGGVYYENVLNGTNKYIPLWFICNNLFLYWNFINISHIN